MRTKYVSIPSLVLAGIKLRQPYCGQILDEGPLKACVVNNLEGGTLLSLAWLESMLSVRALGGDLLYNWAGPTRKAHIYCRCIGTTSIT